jgi:ribosomal protein S18 acetylase RimI-like enzyme
MSRITVRPYRPDDRRSLVELWRAVFADDPARNDPEVMIANKERIQPELLLVALDGDRTVGAVMAGFDGTRGWIHHLAVDPRDRRRGIGSELVRAAEGGLRKLGCPKVNLQVRAENAGVVTFYEGLGFRVEERVSMGKLLQG